MRDWIEGLNKDLVVAAGLVGTLGLATGFMLTWARVASEDIPAQPILGALPTSYYVTVAIRSMLAPLMIALVAGVIWIRLGRHDRLAGWALFGFGLGILAAFAATWLNHASLAPALGLSAAIVAGSTIVAVGVGARYRHRTAGSILAATALLGFAVPCAARILDAAVRKGSLPFTQVVVDYRCVRITGGVMPAKEDAERCQIGGFFLGGGSDDVLIVRRSNPCKAASPPQLLMIARDRVQSVVTWDRDRDCT